MSYYITSTADTTYNKTNAKTLAGAKRIASNTYQPSVFGRIWIVEVDDSRPAEDRDYHNTVAVKHGYDKWTNV